MLVFSNIIYFDVFLDLAFSPPNVRFFKHAFENIHWMKINIRWLYADNQLSGSNHTLKILPDIFSGSFCQEAWQFWAGGTLLPSLRGRESLGKYLTTHKIPVLQPGRVSVWKGALSTRAHQHGSRQPDQALLTIISLEGCFCPVNFKVAVETDVKNPRVLWQTSRPLKVLCSLTSGNVCCSWPWSQSVPHPNRASGESIVSKNCSQRSYLSLHYQNKNIPATPKYPANEKLSYLAQLDYPDDLEVNFPVLSYISHQIKGLDYLNICLSNSPCCHSPGFTNHFCSYKSTRH